MSRRQQRILMLVAVWGLFGCNTAERLSQIGRAPELSPLGEAVSSAARQPVPLPMPAPEPTQSAGANSLWRSGAKGFFRDQRARRVGDVLTVALTIADDAQFSNETSRSRRADDGLGLDAMLGFQTQLDKILPSSDRNPLEPENLVAASSRMRNEGSGEVQRNEKINMSVAAVITGVLPNGNLVIQGKQEIRVNFEVREIVVAGIARPEDITPNNVISHEKIAELRFSYGGRGHLTDVQQPRYGSQLLDIILPY